MPAPYPVGLHLRDLITVCLGLKTTVNAAFTAAGIPVIVSWNEQPRKDPTRLKPPLVTVGLAGHRGRSQQAIGDDSSKTLERVVVVFTLEDDGLERDQLASEGVLQAVLRGSKATIAAGLQQCQLERWYEIDGNNEIDRQMINRVGAWEATIQFEAWLLW